MLGLNGVVSAEKMYVIAIRRSQSSCHCCISRHIHQHALGVQACLQGANKHPRSHDCAPWKRIRVKEQNNKVSSRHTYPATTVAACDKQSRNWKQTKLDVVVPLEQNLQQLQESQ